MAVAIRALDGADLERVQAARAAPGAAPSEELELLAERLGRPSFESFGAFEGERLVGACVVSDWGAARLIGRPWVSGKPWPTVAPPLLAAVVEHAAASGAVLLTDLPAQKSPLLGILLLQKHGLWPGYFIAHLSRSLAASAAPRPSGWERSASVPGGVDAFLDALRPGLRLPELGARAPGEELLVRTEAGRVTGLALCRLRGATLSLRFGAVLPGTQAAERFGGLLDACAGLGVTLGARKLRAAANAGRGECHTLLRQRGFRNVAHGFAFHRPDDPFTCRPGLFVVEDWR